MQRMDVSICLITKGDTYILQQRENDPAKGAAGLIGAFGGKIETNETPVEAVCRELSEETSLRPLTEDFDYLGDVNVVSDRNHEPVHIMARVFRLLLAPDTDIQALDGELARITAAEVQRTTSKLTPATQAAFEQFIERE